MIFESHLDQREKKKGSATPGSPVKSERPLKRSAGPKEKITIIKPPKKCDGPFKESAGAQQKTTKVGWRTPIEENTLTGRPSRAGGEAQLKRRSQPEDPQKTNIT